MSDIFKNPNIETITPIKIKLKVSFNISLDKIKKIINKIKLWKIVKGY